MSEPAISGEASPFDLYGPLLVDVQTRRLFADGKTFVDAVPLRGSRDIMADYEQVPRDDEAALTAFVRSNFRLPSETIVPDAPAGRDLRTHIHGLWITLVRAPAEGDGSLLALQRPYLVPGGRFTELYYWDSYFSMLGLIRDGHHALADAMVETFTDLIERYGHIPNGTRTYYLERSQPPLYWAMVKLVPHGDRAVMRRRLRALRREHAFWMTDADALAPGQASKRVVRLADGHLLNRYWDPRDTPRDESFGEDLGTAAAAPARPPAELHRHLRAGAESGWDFSSRWLAEGGTLPTIRTTDIVPADLNALLHGLEAGIADLAYALHDDRTALDFRRIARRRREAMRRHLWSADTGCFVDHDLALGRCRHAPTAAALAPLFTGVATRAQAAATARTVAGQLLGPGGLRTTLVETGQQWDWPNGWAPLQWIAFEGLRRYGFMPLALEIARRWSKMVAADFAVTGWLHEKYDVERGGRGGGGEYVPQHGFGWTNGVTATFLDILAAHSILPAMPHGPLTPSDPATHSAQGREAA